jgi:FtsH-binding integral membrane protein
MFATGNYKTAGEVNQAMGRVYGYMGLATLVSMLVSFGVGSNPELVKFFFTGIMHWVVIFAPLVAVFFLVPFIGANPPKGAAVAALMAFSALMGLSFAVIFAVYTVLSIVNAFMGAAVLFTTMSLYGYFTKRDLSGIGDMLLVALIAIIIASVINIFIGSTVMQMVISAIAILIFLGFTAYDTQQIREMVSSGEEDPAVEILGALNLYLDFINLFLNLLQLFGITNNSDD